MALILPDLDLWRVRLEAEAMPPLAQVRVAASPTAVVAENVARYPAAFLFLVSDTAEAPQDTASSVIVTMSVGVAILVQDLRSLVLGTAGVQRHRECRQAVIGALHTFLPGDGLDHVIYSAGELLEFAEGIQIFVDRFSMAYLVRL